MMVPMALPGLDRLLEVCQWLNLGLETSPPAHEPSMAGSLLEGVPFDPILASVYARFGHAGAGVRRFVSAPGGRAGEDVGENALDAEGRGPKEGADLGGEGESSRASGARNAIGEALVVAALRTGIDATREGLHGVAWRYRQPP